MNYEQLEGIESKQVEKLNRSLNLRSIPLPTKDWWKRNGLKCGYTMLALTALGLLWTSSKNLGSNTGTVPIPGAEAIQAQRQQQSRDAVLEQASLIVRSQPLPIFEQGDYQVLGRSYAVTQGMVGQQGVIILDPQIIAVAAQIVLDWQSSQLLQQYTSELYSGIRIGMGTPGHVCYGLQLQGCIETLRKGGDIERQDALVSGNLAKVDSSDFFLNALALIEQGQTQVGDYQPELHKLAMVMQREAQERLKQISPDGQAQQILGQ